MATETAENATWPVNDLLLCFPLGGFPHSGIVVGGVQECNIRRARAPLTLAATIKANDGGNRPLHGQRNELYGDVASPGSDEESVRPWPSLLR